MPSRPSRMRPPQGNDGRGRCQRDAPALAVAYVGTAIRSQDGRRHRSGGRDADARRPAGRGEGHPHLRTRHSEDQQNLVWALGLQHSDDPVGFTQAASAVLATGAMAFSGCVGAVEQSTVVPSVHLRITITSSSAASGELPHPTRSRRRSLMRVSSEARVLTASFRSRLLVMGLPVSMTPLQTQRCP